MKRYRPKYIFNLQYGNFFAESTWNRTRWEINFAVGYWCGWGLAFAIGPLSFSTGWYEDEDVTFK